MCEVTILQLATFATRNKSRWCNYFSGHIAFVSEQKSFRLSRKVFSVFKNTENRDIFAVWRNDDHDWLTCNCLSLGEFSELSKNGRPFFARNGQKKWSRQASLHAPQVRFIYFDAWRAKLASTKCASYGKAVLHKSAFSDETAPFHSAMKHLRLSVE